MDRFVKLSEISSLLSQRTFEVSGSELLINWQTDTLVPQGKTFAEVFGNEIFKAIVAGDDGSGFITPFECNLSYNMINEVINQVKVENILFPGKLTFI